MILPYSFLALSLASILIGGVVLNDRPHRTANQAFWTFSIGISLWIGSFGFLLLTGNQIFIILLNIGGLILVYGLTRFATAFPSFSTLPVRPFLFWSPLLLGGVSMLITNTIVVQVQILPGYHTLVTHGPLIWLWSLLLLTYILIALTFLARSYKFASQGDRSRLKLVYIGLIVFVLCAIIFDALLPAFFSNSSLNIVGPLSALGFLATTAYAIVRHQFMNIRLIIQRGFIYSCTLFILVSAYIVILGIIHHFALQSTGLTESFSIAITIAIGIYTLPRMEAYFLKISDPWFFKQRYDYFSILDQLTLIVNENVSLRPMAFKSLEVLDVAFKPTYSYFFQSASNYYYSVRTISLSQLEYELELKHQLRISLCAGTRKIGEYVLGRRRSGEAYSPEDYSLIRTFAAHAQIAFEKAELFQKLQEHSDKLELKIEERTRRIQNMRRRERELFDDLSHALQTPLTVLKGGLELMYASPSASGPTLQRSLESSINNLSQLVRSMLKIARVDSEPESNSFKIVDLTSLLEKIGEYSTIVAEAENISFSSNIQANIRVYGDAQQIEEAITNVVANSIKFTSGCDIRKVHIAANTDRKYAHITIFDTGVGMGQEDQSHAFERFYRSKNSSNPNTSTGLGLAITRRIVERHSGTITLKSALNNGTNVSMSIPLTQQADSPQ